MLCAERTRALVSVALSMNLGMIYFSYRRQISERVSLAIIKNGKTFVFEGCARDFVLADNTKS